MNKKSLDFDPMQLILFYYLLSMKKCGNDKLLWTKISMVHYLLYFETWIRVQIALERKTPFDDIRLN